MIFVTVGTTQYPFDRLLKTIDNGIKMGKINQQIFAQSGSSNYRPLFFDYKQFLPFDEVVEFIQKSDIIVAHDGVGSALLCLSLGKIPILFPRRPHLGEAAYHTHVEFARQMEKQRSLLVAYDEQDLLDKIKNYKELTDCSTGQSSSSDKNKLVHFLKTAIEKNIP